MVTTGGPFDQFFRIVHFHFQDGFLLKGCLFHFILKLCGNQHRRFKINGLVCRDHHPHAHQFGDHLVDLDAHPFGQIGKGDGFIDLDPSFDGLGRRDLGAFRLNRFSLGAFAPFAAFALAGVKGSPFDHLFAAERDFLFEKFLVLTRFLGFFCARIFSFYRQLSVRRRPRRRPAWPDAFGLPRDGASLPALQL